jgi:hypothetical protein
VPGQAILYILIGLTVLIGAAILAVWVAADRKSSRDVSHSTYERTDDEVASETVDPLRLPPVAGLGPVADDARFGAGEAQVKSLPPLIDQADDRRR